MVLHASVLHGLETQRTLKLITRGRLTGLPHIAELRFAYLDNAIYVVAGNSYSDWVLNALASRETKVKIGQTIYPVVAKAGSKLEKEQALESFRRKYSPRMIDQWYGGAQLCLRLDQSGPPIARGSIRGEVDTLANFSQWKKIGTPYRKSIEQAFDSASEEYDYTISRNYINTWIRERSINEVLKLTQFDDLLLEIGCGTGTEAIRIAKHVAGIVATDISQKMLETLNKKVKAKKLEHKISTLQVAASSISSIQSYLPEGKVRIAYSFNGALNCEPELHKVPEELCSVLSDDGYFLCSIRNTICLPEVLSHSLVLQFNKTVGRKKQPKMVSVGGLDIPSFYYSVDTFATFFRPYFRLKKIIGLPAILPPAYLSEYYLRVRMIRPFLERLEVAIAGWFPFNRLGDQTLFVFQKV